MQVTVAKSAGFCFGVQRAVDTVYEQVEKGIRPIYTYGPIIHNEVVVQDLEEKGVQVLDSQRKNWSSSELKEPLLSVPMEWAERFMI